MINERVSGSGMHDKTDLVELWAFNCTPHSFHEYRQWHIVLAVFGGGWWGCEAKDELYSKFRRSLDVLCASSCSSYFKAK